MSSDIYCVEMNNEIVGYVHGDFDYHCRSEENEKAYKDAQNVVLKIFNNMGFSSEDDYFNSMYYNMKYIEDLTRDVTGTITYYNVWKKRNEDPIFKIRMTSEILSDVNTYGSHHSYTRIDEDLDEMIKNGGSPCMFLIRPKIRECWYEVGTHSNGGCSGAKTAPPDIVWFCEDWDNKTERHKLEYWYYQLAHERKRLCSGNEPHWPTDDEVKGPSFSRWGYYEEKPKNENKLQKQKGVIGWLNTLLGL